MPTASNKMIGDFSGKPATAAYEKTGDSTLFLNVRLDRPLEDPRFHRVDQVSANRWNHHVVVKTMEAAQSDWLRDLIRAGHEFAAR